MCDAYGPGDAGDEHIDRSTWLRGDNIRLVNLAIVKEGGHPIQIIEDGDPESDGTE